MSAPTVIPASSVEAEAVVRKIVNETATPETVDVGGKAVEIKPLRRRWQMLFAQAALPLLRSELEATESIQKAFSDGTIDFTSISKTLIDSEVEACGPNLDRAAAVILASQIPGSEKTVEPTIKEQIEWLQSNARTEELRALVEAQGQLERLVEQVGERLPARFARSLHLAGMTDVTEDSVKQLLTNSFVKLRGRIGDGG